VDDPTSDDESITRRGDDYAFAEVVRRNAGWVHGVARRRLRDPGLADDVVQAVFILLHRKSPHFSSDRALVAWLHRTAVYASEVADRQRRRRQRHEQEAAAMRHENDSSREVDPQWQELAPLLDELIERLGRRDREAVLLRFFRRMTFAEVAAATEPTEEAARKRVDRALEKLRGWAASRGATVASSAALSMGIDYEIASAAPAGVVATATGAALASADSAMAASTLPLTKGTIAMMTFAKAKLVASIALAVVVTTAGGVALIAATNPASRPVAGAAKETDQRREYDKLAPYDAIRWQDARTPIIRVNGTWYAWRAIGEVEVAKLIDFAAKTWRADEVEKRIGEDLVEALTRMGHAPGVKVTLGVVELDTSTAKVLKDVPMTKENRQRVWHARQAER
jgi:RNA polymerase sigma factor (sigma-70 family)